VDFSTFLCRLDTLCQGEIGDICACRQHNGLSRWSGLARPRSSHSCQVPIVVLSSCCKLPQVWRGRFTHGPSPSHNIKDVRIIVGNDRTIIRHRRLAAHLGRALPSYLCRCTRMHTHPRGQVSPDMLNRCHSATLPIYVYW